MLHKDLIKEITQHLKDTEKEDLELILRFAELTAKEKRFVLHLIQSLKTHRRED